MFAFSGHRLVVPHKELGIFLKNLVRNLAGYVNDRGVVAFLPGFFESGADGLQAEYFEALLLGFAVFLEFAFLESLA